MPKVMLLIALAVVTSGAGQLLLKAGAIDRGSEIARDVQNLAGWLRLLLGWKTLLGLGFWTASALLYLLVLSRTQLSFAFCVASLNYVVVPLAARWLFAESLSMGRYVGMAVIALGVAITLWARVTEQGGG